MNATSSSRFGRGVVLLAAAFALPLGAQTRYDLFLTMSDGDSLDATYYYPQQPPPAQGYPAVLFVHGFGASKDTKISSCSSFAANGYVTLAYTVRGHRFSSGSSTIMDGRERADLGEVLQFLRHLPGIDTASVGLVGSSQGGLHGLWAAAAGMPLAAIVSDVIAPRWATDMLSNGSVRRTLLLLLRPAPPTVTYGPLRDSLWNLVRRDVYDSLLAVFPAGRDVEESALENSQIPMLTMVKWQDHYFSPAGGIDLFLRQTCSKKIYCGTQGHWSDDNPAEALYQSDQTFRWLREFLKRQPTGILGEPPVTLAVSSLPVDSSGFLTWTRQGYGAWPPSGLQDVRFYLHSDSLLGLAPPPHGDSFSIRSRYLNPAYAFDTAWVEGFKGSRFDVLLPKETVRFTSEPLGEDVTWIGAPRLRVRIRPDTAAFPLHAQVFEVDSTGNPVFINRINFTGRGWMPGADSSVVLEGIPHAHRFTRGSRIRVEFTNIDKTTRPVPGPYPFVVPFFGNAIATVSWSQEDPSYLELPLTAVPGGVGVAPAGVPIADRLGLNFPNPFNPSTRIPFTLSRRGPVSVTIRDMLGRVVATLFSQDEAAPGSYTLDWDGRNAASGVYFCELLTSGTRQVNKLLLIR